MMHVWRDRPRDGEGAACREESHRSPATGRQSPIREQELIIKVVQRDSKAAQWQLGTK